MQNKLFVNCWYFMSKVLNFVLMFVSSENYIKKKAVVLSTTAFIVVTPENEFYF